MDAYQVVGADNPCVEACMAQWERDNAVCRTLQTPRQRSLCWATANQALARCLENCPPDPD